MSRSSESIGFEHNHIMHVFRKLGIGVTQMVLISEAEAAGEGRRGESSVTAETLGQRRGGDEHGPGTCRALLPGLQPPAEPELLPAARSGTGCCGTEWFTRNRMVHALRGRGPAAPCPLGSAQLRVWGHAALPQRGEPVTATCQLPGGP